MFEKEHGNLNEGSDFDLYNKYLDKAIEFNNANNVDFDIEEILNIWQRLWLKVELYQYVRAENSGMYKIYN